VLAHKREALGVVHQAREVDQVRCRHDGKGSSRLPPSHQIPDSGTTRITTLEPDKSLNSDRAGFQRDLNVVYPIDRLRELAAEGVIGGVAETHFSVMGSTDPAGMTVAADQIAGQLRQERIDSILLSPV